MIKRYAVDWPELKEYLEISKLTDYRKPGTIRDRAVWLYMKSPVSGSIEIEI